MEIVITLLIVFILSFLFICKFIYNDNKKEPKEEQDGLLLVVLGSVFFSLIIAGTIGLSIFAVLGTTNLVNIIFSLNIDTNQLIALTISFFVYLFVLDDVIGFIVKYIFGKNIVYMTILTLIRISIFHIIGYFVGLSHTTSLTIAIGVAFITVLFEGLSRWKARNKHFGQHQ